MGFSIEFGCGFRLNGAMRSRIFEQDESYPWWTAKSFRGCLGEIGAVYRGGSTPQNGFERLGRVVAAGLLSLVLLITLGFLGTTLYVVGYSVCSLFVDTDARAAFLYTVVFFAVATPLLRLAMRFAERRHQR